jgi:hypothetical protein
MPSPVMIGSSEYGAADVPSQFCTALDRNAGFLREEVLSIDRGLPALGEVCFLNIHVLSGRSSWTASTPNTNTERRLPRNAVINTTASNSYLREQNWSTDSETSVSQSHMLLLYLLNGIGEA